MRVGGKALKQVGEFDGMAERDAVTTVDLVGHDPKSIVGKPPLKACW